MAAANQLLQGDRERADCGDLRINSSAGLLGLFDPATAWGYPAQTPEDFGQTLASYGMPAGPYLVLPLVGPATPRDAFGRVGDYLALGTYLDTDALNLFLGAMAVTDAEPDSSSTTQRSAMPASTSTSPRVRLMRSAVRPRSATGTRPPTRAMRASSRSSRRPGGGGTLR